jgi:uncharacterized membrane protein YccC
MLLPLELVIVVALVLGGCWSRRAALVFLPVIGVALMVFAVLFGNPIGLLTSESGWLILDSMLVIAVLLAHVQKNT